MQMSNADLTSIQFEFSKVCAKMCKVNILKTLEVITTKYPWPGKRLNQHEKRKDYVHHNGLDRWEVCS